MPSSNPRYANYRARQRIRKQLELPAEQIFVTSSQTGAGIDELKRRIAEHCLDE